MRWYMLSTPNGFPGLLDAIRQAFPSIFRALANFGNAVVTEAALRRIFDLPECPSEGGGLQWWSITEADARQAMREGRAIQTARRERGES